MHKEVAMAILIADLTLNVSKKGDFKVDPICKINIKLTALEYYTFYYQPIGNVL